MKNHFCLAAVVLAFLTVDARAAVITFEGHPNSGNPTEYQDGYTFTFAASGWGIFTDARDPTWVHNGTTRLVLADGSPGSVAMSQTNSNPFSLQSFDAATMFTGRSGTINITGNISGGGTLLASVNVGDTFSPFVLVGFNNLSSVVFAESVSGAWPNTPGLSLDNLTVDAPGSSVPEPALAGMVALSLGALGLMRRRKQPR